jgi:hypothetical protein
MKEELQGKLVEILTSIQAVAGKASDFAMAELPDIAQSYVVYGRAVGLFWVVFGIALIAVGLLGLRHARAYTDGQDRTYMDSFLRFMYADYAAAVLACIFGAVQLVLSVNQAALVWLAPKVWLLKEIATLIK